MDIKKSLDKILAAAEASLLICHLYSTSKKTKSVPDENMEKIVKFVDLQMRKTIFPIYDRFFAAEFVEKPKKMESINIATDEISLLYEKLFAIIKIFKTLFVRNTFTDPVLKKLLAISVKSLFVDKIAAMQNASIDLVTTVSQYSECGNDSLLKIKLPFYSFSDFPHKHQLSQSNFIQYSDIDRTNAAFEPKYTSI